ncbi:DUF4251 domain-containing protein [Formosa sp. 3Alg 14/1]|uniref:DUF4251 domain-containing protein n=1 Tax=Formosa sp. 3Alg 14/1 TaxID=3382190 RepID=UPI0039BDDA85
MKKHIFLIIALVFGIQFTFSQTKAERKAAKLEQQEHEYAEVKSLIEDKHFTFEGEWATTQKGRRISLIGNPNYLVVDSTQTKAELPYFGIVQIANYGGDGGISFDNTYSDYKVNYNDKKRRATIEYATSNKNEKITVTLQVYSLESASLTIYSSNRNSISYDGILKPIATKTEE